MATAEMAALDEKTKRSEARVSSGGGEEYCE